MNENTVSNSQQLRRKINLVLPALTVAGSAINMHPQVAQLYPRYLFNLHCMMRAAVPLMEAAIKSAQVLHAVDPVATQMIPYLQKHIPEETHSHWPLEDLEALGFDPEDILKRTPSPAVAALVGTQYYWIFHYHPVALLGYLEFAEGYPPIRTKSRR